MDNMSETIGMVRRDGPITSVMAAEVATGKRMIIRARVETFARFRPYGFIDADLFEYARDLHVALGEKPPPESSYRKRRKELCDDNIILADEEKRKNDHDQATIVWYHRDHVLNPPPIKPPEKKPSRFAQLQEENATLRANNAQLCAEIERLNGIIAKTGFGF